MVRRMPLTLAQRAFFRALGLVAEALRAYPDEAEVLRLRAEAEEAFKEHERLCQLAVN